MAYENVWRLAQSLLKSFFCRVTNGRTRRTFFNMDRQWVAFNLERNWLNFYQKATSLRSMVSTNDWTVTRCIVSNSHPTPLDSNLFILRFIIKDPKKKSRKIQFYSNPLAADLVLTAGSTYGLHQILTTLVDLDGYIFLDEVTYMIALEAIALFPSIKIIPVKLNPNGVDIEDLEAKVAERKFESKDKMFWAGKVNYFGYKQQLMIFCIVFGRL